VNRQTEPLGQLKKLKSEIGQLKERVQRLKEIGRAKEQERKQVEKNLQREASRVGPLDDTIQALQREEGELMERSRSPDLQDRIIGQFIFPISKLSSALNGQALSSIKEWFETPDLDGKRVRGEDYGVTALQVEMKWIPECSEYATRLCNIGNLHRILGDKLSARTGGVCEQYKKVEENYNLAESHLEASLLAMERVKSIVPPRAMSTLQALRAKGGLRQNHDSPEGKAGKGKETDEYLVVLENLALLHHSRSLALVFPKGTPESVKAAFEGARSKSERQAVRLLEEVMQLRSDLTWCSHNKQRKDCPECRSTDCETEEFLRLLRTLSQFHAENGKYQDAMPVQEKALHLARKLHGDKSREAAMDMEILCQMHLRLGDAHVVKGDHGSWVIDSNESWHWNMVGKLGGKVNRAAASMHDFSKREAGMLRQDEEAMLHVQTRILNPPPITDYSEPKDEDPLLKKAQVSTLSPRLLPWGHDA